MPKRRTAESPYAKAVADADARIDARIEDADRYRCHYAIDGMRCSARGSICESISGPDKGEDDSRRWLCSAHWQLRDDPLGSREVVADLAARSPKRPEDWREKMLLEHGLGELQTAWRDMSPEEKQALIHETIRKGKNFVRSVIPRPEKPAGQTGHIDPARRSRQLEALYRLMTPEQRAEHDRGAA
jgi:hypothetical protein